jgi:hypothetical protein
MQEHRVQFHRCRGLFWTRGNDNAGLTETFNVPEKLLTFFVLRTRKEGTNKRFDRVTRVTILQRSAGSARDELLVKLLLPPFGCAKERNQFVRHVLETSSTEVPEDSSEFVVGIHSRLPPRIGVPLTTVF